MPGKRYYWLKLQADFFDSLRVKKLRKLAGGDTYTIIYLKMQLLSLKSDGILRWSGIEDDFASELALDLDEKPENVAVTLQYLLSCGLAETEDNTTIFLPWVAKNTGSEGAGAQRMRELRARQRADGVSLCDADVTPALRLRDGEKELEKEVELEVEKDFSSSFEEKESKEKEVSPERAARLDHFVELLRFAEQYGYDKAGTYRLAESEGISQSEILTWRSKNEARSV